MDRSAAAFHGHKWPDNVAYKTNRGFITWDQVMVQRRDRQARRLEDIRRHTIRRPVRIHVRYFDQDLLGGWQTYIEGTRISRWLTCHHEGDRDLMSWFPFANDWYDWMEAFAHIYQRGTFCKRPRGVVYTWAEVVATPHYWEDHLREVLKPDPMPKPTGHYTPSFL